MARTTGKCIFCQRYGNISKEHIWSDWMADESPREAIPVYHEYHAVRTRKTILVGEPKLTTRQGDAITKKVRVVCRNCNHGWMKAIEDAAIPILKPLIRGERIVLNLDQQKSLAEWICLKVMVSEHNVPADVVVPRIDKERFFVDRTIPAYFRIWVISSASEKWRSRYIRHTATLSQPGTFPTSRGKNTQSIAWGVGRLFIFVMMSTAPGVELTNFVQLNPVVLRLFPYAGETLPLPFLRSIDDASGDSLANTFDMLLGSPEVVYKDFPESS